MIENVGVISGAVHQTLSQATRNYTKVIPNTSCNVSPLSQMWIRLHNNHRWTWENLCSCINGFPWTTTPNYLQLILNTNQCNIQSALLPTTQQPCQLLKEHYVPRQM